MTDAHSLSVHPEVYDIPCDGWGDERDSGKESGDGKPRGATIRNGTEHTGDKQVVRVQYDTPYVRNSPIRLLTMEASGQGGVSNRISHPAWGDPFVEEWKAFYRNVAENKVPKTDPNDFAQDLELFTDMVQLMG